MPRRNRTESKTGFYHFINRGVNKKTLFHKKNDYEAYLKLIEEYSIKLGIKIYHYCLMSNHSHILLNAESHDSLSKFAHFIQRRYAYYYCKTYHWSEQVFRKRFISIPIERDEYLLECGRYIERNPLSANLVKDPKNYPYSSYSFYGDKKEDLLITQNPLYDTMGKDPMERMAAYRFYVCHQREQEKELSAHF